MPDPAYRREQRLKPRPKPIADVVDLQQFSPHLRLSPIPSPVSSVPELKKLTVSDFGDEESEGDLLLEDKQKTGGGDM